MFNPQQCSDNNFASFCQSLNPVFNPNLNLIFPQPAIPSQLPPPGIDPCGPLDSNPPNSGGSDDQTPIFDEPNGVLKQADQITDSIAINSSNVKSMASSSMNSFWTNNLMNQHFVNNVTKAASKKSKVIQSIRCEVCDIDCNSKDAYEKHIEGKRHKKRFQMHNDPITTTVFEASAAVCEGLETKRQKLVENGTTVSFTRVCTLCNVVCNSQEVFDKHLAGKKHAAQARKQSSDGRNQSAAAADANPNLVHCPMDLPQENKDPLCEMENPNILPGNGIGPMVLPEDNKNPSEGMEVAAANPIIVTGIDSMVLPRDNKNSPDGMELSAGAIPNSVSGMGPPVDVNNTNTYQYAWCEVCNIYCTGQDILMVHKSGKKHLKNLVKLKSSQKYASMTASNSAPAKTNPVTVLEGNPVACQDEIDELKNKNAAKSQVLREELETKKRKMMEGGAAVDAVRTCTICNVVCNSQTVFESHLAGQKHATMVRKQGATSMATAGSQVLTAT